MELVYLPVIVFSTFWAIVGLVMPFFVPRSRNRGITQSVLILTAVTCWLFWLLCYMAQMNPLIGPKLHRHVLLLMAQEWGSDIITSEGSRN